MGKHKDKLCKEDKQILAQWKNGQKSAIKADFIVYIPNHIMTAFTSSTGNTECSNKFPHVTLLLKEKASAVESNDILTALYEKAPEIFKKREKKVNILNIPYAKVSEIVIVIDISF